MQSQDERSCFQSIKKIATNKTTDPTDYLTHHDQVELLLNHLKLRKVWKSKLPTEICQSTLPHAIYV